MTFSIFFFPFSSLRKKYYCNKNSIKISDTKYVEYAICNIELKNEFVSIFETDVENKKIDILKYEKIGDKYIVIC